ncbi:MAG: hypothetical protein QOH74_460 [Gaiellales bacterium]|jgi:hypothetical protein|nr:hypothetical protein [Gaiellales bacterium]
MKVAFTARRLRQGSYDAWRKAWEGDGLPEYVQRAYILRNPSDPDEVIAFGLFDVGDDEMSSRPDDVGEQRRMEAMEPHVAETMTSGIYDVIYHREGGKGTGTEMAVPLTQRFVKEGSEGVFKQAAEEAAPSELPAGLTEVFAIRSVDRPNEVISFGIIRTDDLSRMREERMGGRQHIADAMEPHVERIGLDATYEVVEELIPSHA